MTRWILTAVLTGTLLSGAAGAEAAPASGYNQFIQSLDAVLAGAVMPVADEPLPAVRSFSLSGKLRKS